jgi:hypothetical protein
MQKKILFSILLFQVVFVSFGQVNQTTEHSGTDEKGTVSGDLILRVENENFVKNNEYFGHYTEGYTLMGYYLQPALEYHVSKKLLFKAGIHLQKYSGVEGYSDVLPVYAGHYKFSKIGEMVIGKLNNNKNHQLIEPIFNPENQFMEPVENGIQFLVSGKKLRLDAWVDWEQFIFWGDTKPEKFTGGLSGGYEVTNINSSFSVQVPVQMIATHVGGQISDYPEKMQSLVNLASGLELKYDFGGGFIKEVEITSYYLLYKDLTKKSGFGFSSGQAIYPTASISSKYLNLKLGYWEAENFVAPKGSNLFQSISGHELGYYQKHRQMLTSKLKFEKAIHKKVKFMAMFETYYDLADTQFNYALGINLAFTPSFFLSNVPFR